MKKIDIEDMERRMPYEVPKDFFSEMQKNVLNEIAEKKIKRFHIGKTVWAVAASLVILFGVGFVLLRQNTNQLQPESTPEVAVAQIKPEVAVPQISESSENVAVVQAPETKNTVTISRTVVKHATKAHRSTVAKKIDPVERMYNEAVNNLTSQELAEQSRRYEMDTYLDLY